MKSYATPGIAFWRRARYFRVDLQRTDEKTEISISANISKRNTVGNSLNVVSDAFVHIILE